MKELKIDLKQLKEDKKRNFQERLKFIDMWVDYIKSHKPEEWSEQQRMLIDSQMQNSRDVALRKSSTRK